MPATKVDPKIHAAITQNKKIRYAYQRILAASKALETARSERLQNALRGARKAWVKIYKTAYDIVAVESGEPTLTTGSLDGLGFWQGLILGATAIAAVSYFVLSPLGRRVEGEAVRKEREAKEGYDKDIADAEARGDHEEAQELRRQRREYLESVAWALPDYLFWGVTLAGVGYLVYNLYPTLKAVPGEHYERQLKRLAVEEKKLALEQQRKGPPPPPAPTPVPAPVPAPLPDRPPKPRGTRKYSGGPRFSTNGR